MSTRADRIEVVRAQRLDPFHDAGTPVEIYDLRLDGSPVGQVVRDATQLHGMRTPTHQWVLVQKDADLVLAVDTAEQALEQARLLVGERLATGELVIGRRPQRGSSNGALLVAVLVAVAAIVAAAVRAKRG